MNSEIILPFLLELLAKSGAILLIAALIVRGWGGATAAQRHFVWFAAMVILLLLPLTRLVAPRWAVPIERTTKIGVLLAGAPQASELDFRPAQGAEVIRPHRVAWTLPDWRKVLLGVWMGGVVALFGYRLLGSWRLRRLGKRSVRLPEGRVHELARGVLGELSIGRDVEIRVSDECRVPMTWGSWRPVLMLPAEALRWSEACVMAALRHEAGHISRQDYLVRWVARVTCALYWPNPFIWLAARSLRVAQEQATDDLVLRAGTPPEDYAAQLFEAARSISQSGLFARHAVAMASPATLEDRVLAIVDHGRDRRPLSRFAAWMGAAMIALTLAICTAAQLQGAEKEPIPYLTIPGAPAGSPAEQQVAITSKFIELPTEVRASALLPQNAEGAFSAPQFQAIVKSLNQTKGVDVLSAPAVTMRSKQKAVIQIIREFRSPSDWEKQSGVWQPKEFETKNVGVTLDVIGEIKADGTIDLQLKPSVVEFLGFVDLDTGKSAPAPRSKPGKLNLPDMKPLGTISRLKPIFSERQLTTQINLKPGETVALTKVEETADVKPFEKTAPRRGLIVFVTATVVEPEPKKAVEEAKVRAAAAEKAAGIVIPKIEFRDTAVPDVLQFLNEQARELDPEKEGVSVVLAGPDPGARITLLLRNVPLSEAVRYIASLAGLELVAEPETLILRAPEKVAAAPNVVRPPVAQWVPGKPGFVISPHAPAAGYVDVRGFKPGTEVKCPYTQEKFLVPELPRGEIDKTNLEPRSEIIRPAESESRIEGRVGIELRQANPVVPRRRPGEF
jgi:beta-lactamase regulating signal transducer with metallopeptidase domain